MATYHQDYGFGHLTCRLTAKGWYQLRNPTLVSSIGLPLPLVVNASG